MGLYNDRLSEFYEKKNRERLERELKDHRERCIIEESNHREELENEQFARRSLRTHYDNYIEELAVEHQDEIMYLNLRIKFGIEGADQ